MIEIYKASAGSGKTFTLTREYIKFILGSKDEAGCYRLNKGDNAAHKSVLAITFTNKATEEMKGRIIHELAVIAGAEPGWQNPSPYLDYLCKTFSCSESELAESAGKALRALLFDFDKFNVSTIDAFFQTVLRAFAHEADVSGNYEVELDDTAVMTMGIDRMLQDLNRIPDASASRYLIEWLTRYMIKQIEDGKSFNVFNRASEVHMQLVRFIVGIMDDNFKAHRDEIMGYLNDREKFKEFINALHGRVVEIKRETMAACAKANDIIEAAGGMSGLINSNVLSPIRRWGEKGFDSNVRELSATLIRTHEDITTAFTKKGAVSTLRNPEMEYALYKAVDAIVNSFASITFFNILGANLYQLGLIGSLLEYIDRYRKENSTILLSDTNALLAKIIGDDDSPFLYEKIGNTYRHFLIDEFQDTSHSQWQNLRPLLNESLATDNDNLVIGDEKQCIYRFRDSDPSLLQNLHLDKVALRRSVVKGTDLSENTNWRSSADVVRFNNTLFSAISRILGFDDVYSNVVQQISKKHISHRGYVRLNIYSDGGSDNPKEAALATLATQLHRQLLAGYRPGDIAILVRRWKEGDEVISYLEKVRNENPDFPPFTIVSDKSLLVSRSKAVMLVISHLRYLSLSNFTPDKRKRPHKEVARMLNEYETCISRNMSPSDSLVTAIASLGNLTGNNPDSEPDNESYSGNLDLVSLVESIISSRISPECLESDNIFITAFQDLVVDLMSKGRADIRSFLEWWDETGCKVSVSGAKDDSALNILTVHKSKGLEYRCVHIPFAEFTENNISDTEWFHLEDIKGIDKSLVPPWIPLNVTSLMRFTPLAEEYDAIMREQQLDRLNLLYVAFTRAVDELIVGLKVPEKEINNKKKDTETPLDTARFIFRSIRMCNDSFVSDLSMDAGIDMKDEYNPFTSFSLSNDGIIEVGAPTYPRQEGSKAVSAMSPSTTRTMRGYNVSSNKSVWENTVLDRDGFGKILSARERGLIIHDILSRIHSIDDIDGALNILQTLPVTIGAGPKEKKEIEQIVRQRINDGQVKEWFQGFSRVLIEREVMTDHGDMKRFDRVVWTSSGEIHLIDYKSGSQPPKRYMKQIKSYIEFFKSAGYPKVRGFLYYLDTGKIIEVE